MYTVMFIAPLDADEGKLIKMFEIVYTFLMYGVLKLFLYCILKE